LWKLTDSDEVVGVKVAHAPNQFVLVLGPKNRGVFISDVMGHPTRPRRQNRDVGSSLTLKLELGAFETKTDLIVGHAESALLADERRVALHIGNLGVAPCTYPWRSSGVVAVAIDDHIPTIQDC